MVLAPPEWLKGRVPAAYVPGLARVPIGSQRGRGLPRLMPVLLQQGLEAGVVPEGVDLETPQSTGSGARRFSSSNQSVTTRISIGRAEPLPSLTITKCVPSGERSKFG